MGNKKTTHIRVERSLLSIKNISFPQYSPNDVFKLGLSTVQGLEAPLMKIMKNGKRYKKIKK